MTITPIKPVAESVGLLIEQIDNYIGPQSWFSIETSTVRGVEVVVYNIDPQRYALRDGDPFEFGVHISDLPSGMRILETRAITMLRALQLAAAHLVFSSVENADSMLRVIEGGGSDE